MMENLGVSILGQLSQFKGVMKCPRVSHMITHTFITQSSQEEKTQSHVDGKHFIVQHVFILGILTNALPDQVPKIFQTSYFLGNKLLNLLTICFHVFFWKDKL